MADPEGPRRSRASAPRGSARWRRSAFLRVGFGVGLHVPLWRQLSTSASFGVYYSAIGDVPITENVVDDVISTGYHVSIALVLR